jgi:hypothetical protein
LLQSVQLEIGITMHWHLRNQLRSERAVTEEAEKFEQSSHDDGGHDNVLKRV